MKYLKIIYSNVALFCIATTIDAQTLTVVDNVTMEPVTGASVFAKMPAPNIRSWGTATNENGQADITPIAGEDSLYVRHPSYGTQGFLMQDVKNMNYNLQLSHREVLLDEVVFSANKLPESKADVPYTMKVIDAKDVAFSNPQNTGDALQNTGQVFVQRSQMGGSSPVLRGFEGVRVLMVVDGVRMNNAIYRTGHLQDCITVDQNMLERTEVIFGPSSTMYGSDALGGTMHFYSKKPKLSTAEKPNTKTNAMYRFSSANNESTGHLDFNFGMNKWASLTSITYSDFGDLRMGANANPAYAHYDWCREYVDRVNDSDMVIANSDPLVQKFSGYTQIDFAQKFLVQTNANAVHLFNFQYSTSGDVPRYDRLQQRQNGSLRFAEWYYGPQNRMLASYTFTKYADSTFYDRAGVIIAFQKIDQDRISRRRNDMVRNRQEEDVMVFSFNADLTKQAREHEIRYGIEITHNIVASAATDTDIATGTITDAIPRYADGGSTMSTVALYFSHSIELGLKKQFVLTDGIRFTMTSLHSEWSDTTFYPFPFNETTQTNFAPSGNLGMIFRPGANFAAHMMFSTGFRSPNVDDMSKVFESVPGQLIVPNPDLKPEMVLSSELGMDIMLAKNVQWSIVGYYSKMLNAIVVSDFELEGQDSVLYDGMMSQVVAPQNVNKAFITGFTTGLYADFSEHFSFRSTVTATYGRYEDEVNDTIVPLDHIPPVFGQTGLVYHWKGLEAEVFARYNGWKHIADYSPGGEDNVSQAATDVNGNTLGTPAWATINFRASYQLVKHIGISFACENILDQNYRNFASGISAPGRNFVVALRLHY